MNSKIGVFVRTRPLLNHEVRGKRCLTTSRDTVTIADKKLTFDSVFDESVDQNIIYDKCVKHLVDGCFEGFNGTVFAYGQTGSGKTHSIMGRGTDEDAGIIPRAISQIFDILSSEKAGRIASVRVSMMEIYNDECKDLLHTEIPSRDIMIREDKDGRIFFTGAREEVVSNSQAAMWFLEQGNTNRTTAETMMNQTSSRSHAIFTISIELLEYAQSSDANGQGGSGGSYIQAKLNLVDLAGSERAKRTGAVGVRLKESVGINQGLLSLGKVIRALTSTPIPHVPYRESKLTRFLQDSLGGNSQTVMLACISSAESNLHETLNTLQYASRAKTIQNRVVANISEGAELLNSELETSMVSALRTQMEQLQGKLDFYTSGAHEARAGMPPLPPGHTHTPAEKEDASAVKPSVARILRIVSQLQESLQITLYNIESSGATAASCGVAWQLVVVSREAVQIMQSISQSGAGAPTNANRMSVSMSFRTLRSSMDASGGNLTSINASSEQEIEALKSELAECHEDLKRDEDIFAEKIREMKKAKKTIRDLETANHNLAAKQVEYQEQLLKLNNKSSKTAFTYVPLNPEDKLELSFNGRSDNRTSSGNNNTEFDDLDISIAVAATEPDISSLMEDLEAMAREKDDLLEHSRRAEQKVESVAQSAQSQKEEFVRGQQRLKQRLQDLEQSIVTKQDTILRLTESHNAVKDLADKQTQRAAQLERDSEDLRAKLKALDSQHSRSVEEAEEERHRRRLFEQKLADAQTQLQEMERDRQQFLIAERRQLQSEEKSSADESRRAEKHLNELNDFRLEHARLTAQKEEAESKQRQTVERMTLQLTQQKKKAAESDAQVRMLEEKNAEYHDRLEKLEKEKQANTSANTPKNTGDGLSGDKLKNWLSLRINNINEAKITASDISRLQETISNLQEERSEILRELDPLLKQRSDYTLKLKKTVTKMCAKIEAAKPQYYLLERQLESMKQQSAVSQSEVERVEEQMEAMQESIGTWDEHREECESRLDNGVLDEEALSRLVELQEELETVEAEIALSETSIAQERKKLNKSQTAASTVATLAQNRFVDGEDSSVPDNQDSAFSSALLEELKANLRSGVSGAADSAQLDGVLEQMLSVIVAEKFKVTMMDEAAKQAAQLLDDKQAECDELRLVTLRVRNESIRREEHTRKESEDKIAFLLEQLRNVESRLSQDSHMINERPRTSNSYLSLDRSGTSSGVRGSHSAGGHRPRRPTDSQLLEQVRMDPGDANKELTRRWQAEKERREQLEKRTMELSKQLRQLQQANDTRSVTNDM